VDHRDTVDKRYTAAGRRLTAFDGTLGQQPGPAAEAQLDEIRTGAAVDPRTGVLGARHSRRAADPARDPGELHVDRGVIT
jgi:hypothetical protein